MINITEYPNGTAFSGGAVVFDGTYIWSAQLAYPTLTLQKTDPTTGALLNSYAIAVLSNAASPGHLMSFAGSLWFVGSGAYVEQINPATGALLHEYLVDTAVGDTQIVATSITNDGTSLYIGFGAVTSSFANYTAVCKMTPATGAIVWSTTFSTGSTVPIGSLVLNATSNSLWVACKDLHAVYSLSLAGAVINTVPISTSTSLGPMITNDGQVTIISYSDTSLYQINTGTLALTGPFAVPDGTFPFGLALDPTGNIWLVTDNFITNVYEVFIFNASMTSIDTAATDLVNGAGFLYWDTISNRMWTPGSNATANVILAMNLPAPPPPTTQPFSIILRGVKRFPVGVKPAICPVDEKAHNDAMIEFTKFIG